MSDGHYCVVRDLGPVKGGKGMRHHEVIVDFTVRGVVAFLKALLLRARSSKLPDLHDVSQESDNRSDDRSENRSDSALPEQSNLRRITPKPRTLHRDLEADSEVADSDQEDVRARANARQ
jgi:hypothetical protein